MVKFSDCVEKRFVCNFFFFQNHAEALTLEGTGIENLVSAACLCRERNQKVRFIQGFDLTDGIGTGTGDDNIGQSKQISQFLPDIFILYITFCIDKTFVQFALAAQMDYLKILQKFRKDQTDIL